MAGEPFFGFTPEQAAQAKAIAGGGLGASFLIYLRHPGSLLKAGILFLLGMGSGTLFGPLIDAWLSLGLAASASLASLCSLPVASGILRAVERVDFTAWLPGKKAEPKP